MRQIPMMRLFAARGETLPHARLSEAAVQEIRRGHVPYSRTHGAPALARRYGVHRRTIEKILSWETWAHVRGAA